MMKLNADDKKLHFNLPQLQFHILQSTYNYLIWGRGTGKTVGPNASFSLNNLFTMPQSNGQIVGKSYEQLLTSTLPPLVMGWERFGYKEGVHFWIRKHPPANLKLPHAFIRPVDAKFYISWFNGSGIYLCSQDRNSTQANGRSTEWAMGDEAKLLNYDMLKEAIILPMRGNPDKFSHLQNYLSFLFTSDRPEGNTAKWLLEPQKKMNKELMKFILKIQLQISKLQVKLPKYSPIKQIRINYRINRLTNEVNTLKKGEVFYSEATTFDNIHALGLDYINTLHRMLDDYKFCVSVLNIEIKQVSNNFYHLISEARHGYHKPNYNFQDNADIDYHNPVKDCRWDADCIKDQPLHIAADSNAAINTMVIAHDSGDRLSMINAMHVLHPNRLKDLANKFCDYYDYMHNKDVYYYYDHTFIGESGNADASVTMANDWIETLRGRKWTVKPIYIGKTKSYRLRHELSSRLFKADDPDLGTFEFNSVNCKSWLEAMNNTKVEPRTDGYQKDKTGEKRKKDETFIDYAIRQIYEPHYSDAFDTLLIGTRWRSVQSISDYEGPVSS